jgi:hypothetical protein
MELRGNMPATYEPIQTYTLSSAAASIDFTSRPATYTDLRVVFTWVPSTTSLNLRIRLNNDATTLYSDTYITGNGTNATSARDTSASSWTVNQVLNPSATIPTFNTIDLFSYAGSTFKTALITTSSDRNGTGYTQPEVGLYRSTTAITQVNLVASTGTFNIGSTATLYGIKNA